jgi:hypothetical protein
VSDKTHGVSDTEKVEFVSDSISSLSDTDHSVSDSMSPLSDTGYSLSDSISIVSDTAASVSDSMSPLSDNAPVGGINLHASVAFDARDKAGRLGTHNQQTAVHKSRSGTFNIHVGDPAHGREQREYLMRYCQPKLKRRLPQPLGCPSSKRSRRTRVLAQRPGRPFPALLGRPPLRRPSVRSHQAAPPATPRPEPPSDS